MFLDCTDFISPDVFLHPLQNNEDQPDKPAPPLQQLVDDGILAIVAGADTVSSALTSIIRCLLSHPEVYRALQAEVDRFYPPGEDPFDARWYREMAYLNAVMCVFEVLSLFARMM